MSFDVRRRMLDGLVIPAHPLALTPERRLDERRQRALTRYYAEAGAGGIAVGVHTTQFAIRDPAVALYEPVLSLASATLDEREESGELPLVRVAGVAGSTQQATAEAEAASQLGYHIALVSLAGLEDWSSDRLVEHLRAIGEILPTMGFYLQPAVGGRELAHAFWSRAAELESLLAIKIAPFDRYRTQDVVRAVVEAGRADSIALYTGNDDHIVLDLITPFTFGSERAVRVVGGLLGQWAVWTRRAVEVHEECRSLASKREDIPRRLIETAAQLTDANGAIFDARNRFAGAIPGVNEILRRQGLMQGTWCLKPEETLSPGQSGEIDRVRAAYPHLTDDDFVAEHLDRWMS